MNISTVTGTNKNTNITDARNSFTQRDNSVHEDYQDFRKTLDKTRETRKEENIESTKNLEAQKKLEEDSKLKELTKETKLKESESSDELKENAAAQALQAQAMLQKLELKNNIENEFDKDLSKFVDKDSKFTLNINKLEKGDVEFLKGLINDKTQLQNPSLEKNDMNFAQTLDSSKVASFKTTEFSKTFYDIVQKSYETQKPVRVDFGGNSSVILKIGKDGKVSAQFIPGDAAMEQSLKASLPYLQAKLEEQGLPYSELSYKNSPKQNNQQNNQNRRNKGDDKE